MNIFENVASRKPQKSKFNLTHSRKMSFAPGDLYPIMVQETLPGDRWDYDMNTLVRFQPLQSPMMHLVDVYCYSFFIPWRLCMERNSFETFITGGENGDGKTAQGVFVSIPRCTIVNNATSSSIAGINANNFNTGTLADYLGISLNAITTGTGITINFMPFLAFWRMWCEYFRDQNLQTNWVELYPNLFNGQGDITDLIYQAFTDPTNPFPIFTIPQVCWEKDYFTSALPFAQRGAPVETPLVGNASWTYRAQALTDKPATAAAGQLRAGTAADAPIVHAQGVDGSGTTTPIGIDNIEDIELNSGGFTINALRLASRLQEWLEKMARGGARYIEQIKSHFGVTSSDARLQRTEYLSGGKIPVSISEVLQTGENGTTPLGEMSGHGIAAGKVTHFNKFFEEHGCIISVMFLRPKTAYQQGIPRLFTHRFDKLDWAWPSFAHLGEQEIAQSELYATLNGVNNANTFAYQQRYAEYKYIPSTVHGEFKTTLDFWHWGRIFATPPTLSPEFVTCDPSTRVFNVIQDGDPLYAIVSNRVTCIRPLPYHGEPTL